MTPKEKAEELVNSYRMILMNEDTDFGNEILCTSIAKQCAIIAVDEIAQSIIEVESELNSDGSTSEYEYWKQVKQEIEKL